MEIGSGRRRGFGAGSERKLARLVSVSFPGRDLSLGVVGLKAYAMRDETIAASWSIGIDQFLLDTPEQEMLERLKVADDDCYCFSAYVWNVSKILAVATMLKEWDAEKTVVLGGPEASGMAGKLLREHPCVDYVVKGDGELAFRELLKARDQNDLAKVPNLARRRNGGVVCNPERQVENLDDLPLPYESEDYRRYLDESPAPVRAAIETSRGCPFSCAYCSWGRKRMRYFGLDKLRPAFEYLFRHPKVATVYITDSDPFLKKGRARELLEMLLELNAAKKPVTFELNPEYMDDDGLLEMISQINEEEFAFGVQSTSPKVLDQIERRFDGERYRRNIALMRRTNPKIQMWFSLIIGLPGDNYGQYADSLDYVLNLKPDGIYVHELLCLPGSKFYDHPERYGLEFQEEPPHKITANRTFPLDQYNRAKWLSYNVSLMHRVPAVRDRLFELHRGNGRESLVGLYERFLAFAEGKLDTLGGERIEDVSSWFFEQRAKAFLEASQNRADLESLVVAFEELQRTTGGGAG